MHLSIDRFTDAVYNGDKKKGEVMSSWKCTNCHLINYAEHSSCRHCGMAMNTVAQPYSQPETPYANQAVNWHSAAQPNANPVSFSNPGTSSSQDQTVGFAPPSYPTNWATQPPQTHYTQPGYPDYSQTPSYGAPSMAVYQPLYPAVSGGIWRQGNNVLVMHKFVRLPDCCIKCNAPSTYRLRRNLRWAHPALALLILINLLIYLIVFLAVSKKATVEFGLCEEHRQRRILGIIAATFTMLVVPVGCFVLAGAADAGVFFLFAILAFLGGAIWLSSISSSVTIKKMDDQYIWLKRINREYLAQFPLLP